MHKKNKLHVKNPSNTLKYATRNQAIVLQRHNTSKASLVSYNGGRVDWVEM